MDAAINLLATGKGFSPKDVQGFMTLDQGANRLALVDKAGPIALMATYILTYGSLGTTPNDLPMVGPLPPVAHDILQAIHNITVNSAQSANLLHHLPFLALEGSLGWGGLRTIPNWLRLNRKWEQIKIIQDAMGTKIKNGEFAFKMNSNHTAAFVGNGDKTASHLQLLKPLGEVMLYGQNKIESPVYQLMRKDINEREAFQILDRGDFTSAGEVLISPMKDEDMFLPGNDGHDMTLDEIDALISRLDRYCESRKIEKKRVIILGRKTISQEYRSRDGFSHFSSRTETLAHLVERLKEQRGGIPIDIIDPTEIVMEEIVRRANGRNIQLVATAESDKRYGKRFYGELSAMGYTPTIEGTVNILYNITDLPTQTKAEPSDIAVILDPTMIDGLLAKGMSRENIILVPELVLKKLRHEVDKT